MSDPDEGGQKYVVTSTDPGAGGWASGGQNYVVNAHGQEVLPAFAHDCTWAVLRSRIRGSQGSLLSPERTQVLMRCTICKIPQVIVLAGHWTGDDLMEAGDG